MGQFSVSYGVGNVNLEAPEKASKFLADFRVQILGHSEKESRLLGERQTSLDGHPGIEVVAESSEAQTVTQGFVVKNRFYILTVSLSPPQRLNPQSALRAFNSFRLLPPEVLDGELAKLVNSFSPELLPQDPFVARPTTDAQDERLKGKVKKVSTEIELYAGENPSGIRYLGSEMEFNERGDLTRLVGYDAIPSLVIVYGYLNGQRVARMATKGLGVILMTDKPKAKDYMPPRVERKIDSLKLKYKYNAAGQLIEKRILLDNGDEYESTTYDLKAKKMVHSGGSLWGRLLNSKDTYLLDDGGNPVEQDITRSTAEPYTYVGGEQVIHSQKVTTTKLKNLYTYEFDAHGNWIKRTTSQLETKDGKQVSSLFDILYRTITYY